MSQAKANWWRAQSTPRDVTKGWHEMQQMQKEAFGKESEPPGQGKDFILEQTPLREANGSAWPLVEFPGLPWAGGALI